MQIQLSDKFTYGKLLRFTLPSIAMMVFTSIYGVVDGFFVSNFVGEDAFTAVNFIMPYLMILGGIGFVFGTGGCALIAKTLGEGNRKKANSLFSLFVYLPFALGVVIAILGILLIGPVASLLGAEGDLLHNSILYGSVFLLGLPFYMLQVEFQSFFVTAEKPKLGLLVTIISGVANMVLDGLFVGLFSWGLVGAAVATVTSQIIGGVFPVIYFARENSSLLRLGRTEFDKSAIFQACTNGSSEFMTNISMSLVGMLYNFQLLKYEGEGGVAAYGVLMYVNFVFISMFLGYAIGSAPIISYNYGAGRKGELKSVLTKSLVIIALMSVAMFILGEVLATPMSMLFVGYNPTLLELTKRGFFICSFSFLCSGLAIYGSSFFTALNNGVVSAIISFLRMGAFQVIAVLVLPLWLGLDGIWLSVVVSEALSVLVTIGFMLGKRKKYGY